MKSDEFEALLLGLHRAEGGGGCGEEVLTAVRALVSHRVVCRPPDGVKTCAGTEGHRVGARALGRALVQLDWEGHRCRLTVLVGAHRYQGRLQRQDSRAIRHYAAWLPEDLAPAFTYIEDSIAAASLGLTLAEWRAMLGR